MWVQAAEPPAVSGAAVRARATITPRAGTRAAAVGRLTVTPKVFSVQPSAAATLDLGLQEAVRPRAAGLDGGRSQVFGGLRFSVDGVEIHPSRIGRVTYSETPGGQVASFEVAERADTPAGAEQPLGTAEAGLGLPGGKSSIDVDAIYLTPSGAERVRLMTGGVVDNAAAQGSEFGDVRTVTVVGPHGRYDGLLVDVDFPPGHGLALEEMVEQILSAVGLSASLGTGGPPRYKALQLSRAPWQGVVDELLSAAGKRLAWRRDGSVTVVDLLPEKTAAAGWAFVRGDWADPPGISEAPNADGPTHVVVTGEAQPVHDAEDENGRRSVVTTVEVREPMTRRRCEYTTSDAAGTLAAIGWPSPAVEATDLVRRVVTTRELQVTTPISQRVATYGWMNRERAAGLQQTDGSTSYTLSIFVETTEGPARHDLQDTFQLVRDELTRWRYRASDGYLVERVKEVSEYRFQFKANATVSSTGVLGYTDALSVLWDGRAVEASPVPWRLTERETLAYSVDAEGFILSERETLEAFYARAGGDYFYRGQPGYRLDSTESFRVVETAVTDYSKLGENARLEVVTVTDGEGRTTTELREVADYLPAAARRADFLPDPVLYPRGKVASRDESQALEGEWRDFDLEAQRVRREAEVGHPWIESVEEAVAVARRLVREGAVVPVTFNLPANVLIGSGEIVSLTRRGRSLAVLVDSTAYESDGREAGQVLVGGRWLVI